VGIFVDTSVWSLALRRDQPSHKNELEILENALDAEVYCTGIVLQELLQGFSGPVARQQIIEKFAALPMLIPETSDYIAAADLRNQCRRKGVQVGTIDALIAQLSLRYELALLTADNDFSNISKIIPLTFAVKV